MAVAVGTLLYFNGTLTELQWPFNSTSTALQQHFKGAAMALQRHIWHWHGQRHWSRKLLSEIFFVIVVISSLKY